MAFEFNSRQPMPPQRPQPERRPTFWQTLFGTGRKNRKIKQEKRELLKGYFQNKRGTTRSLKRQEKEVLKDLERNKQRMMRKYGLNRLRRDDPRRERAERHFDRQFGQYEQRIKRDFDRYQKGQLHQLKKGYKQERGSLYD
jgi:hypothetical protein